MTLYDEGVRRRFREKVARRSADVPAGCWSWIGVRDRGGYGRLSVGGRMVRAHRVAFELATGEPIRAGLVIDHRCGTPACVRPDHLRAATQKQNTEHRTVLGRRNTSGFRGVYWNKQVRKWQARAGHNGREYSAGYHDTAEEAAEAAKALRLRLFTHSDRDRERVAS